ncbi:SNF5-domain-containing protein [Meira miltonrushii]|uniref:SNF5-domain-containing protein n=1 Tax=Meira miltonrushii TaxID=1280837 RepID=A0A316VLG3_9BASI|nr:SNF5-domain-containing protein [Meira miltonrushii]PWN38104.1 SNF5-domain-containing protein [Meira miltonrushii]
MDRPRRSGRVAQAATIPSVSQFQTPPPNQSQRVQSNNNAVPSSSRMVVSANTNFSAGNQGMPMYHGMDNMAMQTASAGTYGMPNGGLNQNQAGMMLPPNGFPNTASTSNPALNSFQLGGTSAPVPPQLPIGPGQARFSTLSSRAKVGVTTLMQPISNESNDPYRGVDYGTTERTRGGGSRRRAAANIRYYGEDVSDFEEDDDERGSPSKANTPLEQEEEEYAPGTLLGAPPPGNKVFAKRSHRVNPIAPSESELNEQATKKDFLIPIRIELETDNHRIRDTFTWNIREHIIKPREFAKVYVRDLDLPNEPFVELIEGAIVEQIKLYKESGVDLVDVGPASGGPFASKDGKKRKRDGRNWDWGIKGSNANNDTPTKKVLALEPSAESTTKTNGHHEEESKTDVERWNTEGPDGNFEDDLRVVLDYDVQIYRHHLRDRLEWDLCSPLTPEAFAAQMCKDLCLTGEASPIIANAVREQLLNHLRSVIELDLVGKGLEYARWQQELEEAERDMQENSRRAKEGLPPLPLKPLQIMQEEQEEEPEQLGRGRRRGGGGMEDGTSTPYNESSAAATPAPSSSKNIILRTPDQRRSIAESYLFMLTERGPRKLEGVWREYAESREFGPLIEFLTDEDLEKMDAEATRAGRRNRQRNTTRRRR